MGARARACARPWAREEIEEMCADLSSWIHSGATYLVVGLEVCPNTGRVHLQCYVELAERKRLSEMKKLPRANNWHWEPRLRGARSAQSGCGKMSNG